MVSINPCQASIYTASIDVYIIPAMISVACGGSTAMKALGRSLYGVSRGVSCVALFGRPQNLTCSQKGVGTKPCCQQELPRSFMYMHADESLYRCRQ